MNSAVWPCESHGPRIRREASEIKLEERGKHGTTQKTTILRGMKERERRIVRGTEAERKIMLEMII
jgi:hypothetical protein